MTSAERVKRLAELAAGPNTVLLPPCISPPEASEEGLLCDQKALASLSKACTARIQTPCGVVQRIESARRKAQAGLCRPALRLLALYPRSFRSPVQEAGQTALQNPERAENRAARACRVKNSTTQQCHPKCSSLHPTSRSSNFQSPISSNRAARGGRHG